MYRMSVSLVQQSSEAEKATPNGKVKTNLQINKSTWGTAMNLYIFWGKYKRCLPCKPNWHSFKVLWVVGRAGLCIMHIKLDITFSNKQPVIWLAGFTQFLEIILCGNAIMFAICQHRTFSCPCRSGTRRTRSAYTPDSAGTVSAAAARLPAPYCQTSPLHSTEENTAQLTALPRQTPRFTCITTAADHNTTGIALL